jgi:hypothetical protein
MACSCLREEPLEVCEAAMAAFAKSWRGAPVRHEALRRNSLKLAEQTRSCDYDPCDEGGEAGEQQQIFQPRYSFALPPLHHAG